MHRSLFPALVFLLSFLSLVHAQSAAPQAGFDVKAKQVYLIEAETGTVISGHLRTGNPRPIRDPSPRS